MSIALVIVESPAKCKKIESYLGPGYKVIASFGHLRHISGLEAIDITNNFLTKYSIINEDLKLKQIEKIRSEISNAKDIIIATDDDREGEAIGWHICDLFGLSISKTKRIVFREITESAIKNAIMQPKILNMSLVHSQQARQILDLLVGFTISPLLWKCITKTHDTSLSAGRCQTPALRIIYENYLDNKNAIGKTVYNTVGYFTSLNLMFELNKQYDNTSIVTEFLEKCKTWNFKYSVSSPKKTIKKSPEPLTTSTLQQLASNELHISPKETMKYAQQLYENGYITYMRTDSKKYSNEFINDIKLFITKVYGEQYISQAIDNLSIKITEKSVLAPQEAHESIRPVNINNSISKANEELHTKAVKLYELIWKRTLESCMPSAQYNYINAKISAPMDSEFVYKTEQPIFLGWLIINKKETEQDNNNYQFLQTLKQDVSIKPKKIDSKFTLINLVSHYTEARLVQLLEEKGIGRPSTFASLVDKIQERKYVEKQNISGKEIEQIDFSLTNNVIVENVSKRVFGNENGKLVIQPLGIIVIELLIEKFDMFFNYDYTKEMEDELDKIANNNMEWYKLCEKCYNNLNNAIDKSPELTKFSLEIDEAHILIVGKHGPVIKYTNPENKKDVSFIPVKKSLDIQSLKQSSNIKLEDIIDITPIDKAAIGKYKGKDLFVKNGKYGIYAQWGNEIRSLKEFGHLNIYDIQYIDVIRYLDKDTVLDPKKPIGLVRELNNNLSIRTGKYGDYIFYKKPRMKKPEFYKLNDFNSDYKKCDKLLIVNWIKNKYNIE